MAETSGVGSPSFKPTDKSANVGEGPSGANVNTSDIKVKSLGEMKQVLIQNYGQADGEKLYNNFLKSFAISMLNQMRQSAKQAEEAAKKMREQQS